MRVKGEQGLRIEQRRLTYAPADGAGSEPGEALESYGPQAGMTVSQVLAIARAYWRASILIAFGVIVLATVAIKLLPKTYTATATLIVNSQSNDPLAAQEEHNVDFANHVVTQMELMTAPIVLLPVVDRLKLTKDEEYTAGFHGNSPVALRDYAEKVLAKNLEINTGRGGQLIYVSASARYPTQAASIANAVADVYMTEERRRLDGPAAERAQRYSQELAELRSKAEAAQQNLTDFRQQNGLTDLNENGADSETQALSTLEARLLDAQNERRALEARQTGQEANATEAMNSGQIEHLKTQLSNLREQEAELATTLGPKHPKLLAVKAQIATTQAALDRAVSALTANTDTQLSRAIDLETRLTHAVAAEHAQVLKLRQLQDQGQKLELELQSAQSVYKRALEGYDQIMFASVDHATDVSMISRATAPDRASKPNKIKLLLAAILAGSMFGIASPMAYELLMNRRLRCRDDIERGFGIPVLAQFDAIPPVTART
jgi:protein tyrosine kinase modulator